MSMTLPSKQNKTSLMELIPRSQLVPQQIAVRKGEELPTYKLLRTPKTLDEMNSDTAIWMENGTLVIVGGFFMPSGATTQFSKYLELRSFVTIEIFGDADDAIVDTAVYFGSLRTSRKEEVKDLSIKYSKEIDFDAARSERLAALFQPASQMKITFLSKADKFLSAVLATRPYPIDLKFETSPFDAGAFFEHLESRTTSFGSLSLGYLELSKRLQQRLFHHLHLFEHLQINGLPRELILQLLAAPMKSIGFTLNHKTARMNVAKSDIVATIIRIESFNDVNPSPFLQSFLKRVTETRHLESLSLTLHEGYYDTVTIEQTLIRAVRVNQNLKHLEFMACEHQWGRCIQQLFVVAETHESLRSLKIKSYPDGYDPQYKWLKRLLTRNRYLKVTDIFYGEIEADEEAFRIYDLNQFFRDS
jgi:hypothetical protein